MRATAYFSTLAAGSSFPACVPLLTRVRARTWSYPISVRFTARELEVGECADAKETRIVTEGTMQNQWNGILRACNGTIQRTFGVLGFRAGGTGDLGRRLREASSERVIADGSLTAFPIERYHVFLDVPDFHRE